MKLIIFLLHFLLRKAAVIVVVTLMVVVLASVANYAYQLVEALKADGPLQQEIEKLKDECAQLDGNIAKENVEKEGIESDWRKQTEILTRFEAELTEGKKEIESLRCCRNKAFTSLERKKKEFDNAVDALKDSEKKKKKAMRAVKKFEEQWFPFDWMMPDVLQHALDVATTAHESALKSKKKIRESRDKLKRKYANLRGEFDKLSNTLNITDDENKARTLRKDRDGLATDLEERKRRVTALEFDQLSKQRGLQESQEKYKDVHQRTALYRDFWKCVKKHRLQIIVILIGILFGPLIWAALWYYILVPLAGRMASAIRLTSETTGEVSVIGSDSRSLETTVPAEGHLRVRMGWAQGHSKSIGYRTRLLWDWHAPFTSFAAGLVEMTEMWQRDDAGKDRTVVLSSGVEPDLYLLPVVLNEHPGIVIRPTSVVAVSGDIRLRTQWTLWNLHSWVAGTLRHVIFSGSGTIYLRGWGGLTSNAGIGEAHRFEEVRVIAYDSRLKFSTARTETFWPYYRRKTSLFDLEFDGTGLVLCENTPKLDQRRSGNPFIRTVDAILHTLGKLLGL